MRTWWSSAGAGAWLARLAPTSSVRVVLWLLILAYAVFFSVASIRQHDAFITGKADLGHFDQPIWNSLHGRLLVRTQQDRQLTRLTDHFEPILVPLSLGFAVWDDVRMLLVLQAVAVALGALPVFLLARDELTLSMEVAPSSDGMSTGYWRWVPEVVGLVLACVYLLYPALQAANLTEFHAAPLMVTPMLFALYFARRERFGWMWLWALLVISVKE
jgi:uncharacterized membrane protein